MSVAITHIRKHADDNTLSHLTRTAAQAQLISASSEEQILAAPPACLCLFLILWLDVKGRLREAECTQEVVQEDVGPAGSLE